MAESCSARPASLADAHLSGCGALPTRVGVACPPDAKPPFPLLPAALETSWAKTRVKPCRGGPFRLSGELESESQNGKLARLFGRAVNCSVNIMASEKESKALAIIRRLHEAGF